MSVIIEARNLSKHYGPVEALKTASFDVRKGEVLGFLGPNGAGKTTTMKILTCFIAPTGGTAKVAGCDVFADPIGVRRALGYLPESTAVYTDMIVLEYLEFVAKMRALSGEKARKQLRRVVDQTGLGNVLGKEIRALSKGFKQRVGLAQAMVHEPPVLILDEPMSGLDPNQAVEIRDVIREIGRERTVILSTHNLAEVQVTCGRVLIIAKGRIVADDTPDELRARAGKEKLVVTVAERDGAEAAASEAFARIDGVDSVRPGKKERVGELTLDILPKGSRDLRADVFRAAVDRDLTLLGLRTEGENLEQIFRQLTTGADAEPSDIRTRSGSGAPPSDGADVAESA